MSGGDGDATVTQDEKIEIVRGVGPSYCKSHTSAMQNVVARPAVHGYNTVNESSALPPLSIAFPFSFLNSYSGGGLRGGGAELMVAAVSLLTTAINLYCTCAVLCSRFIDRRL